MKLGIHAYAWCSKWSNDSLHLIDRVKQLGLDFIEIPLMALDAFDARATRERLQNVGLEAVTSTVLLPGHDLTSDDPQERSNGIAYLKECVRAAHAIGAPLLTGVIYAEHAKPAVRRPTEQTWQLAADGLREVAQFALEHGVTLGIEAVNRYETYLVNTCEQALRLKQMIDMPNVKIHLDSYHMNIEEKNMYDATKLAGSDLVHYHLCENDRGVPGTGLVDWDGIFRALGEMRYGGYAAMESFVDITDNMNTWVWRQLAPSGDALLQSGIAFFGGMMHKYGLRR